MIIIFSPLFSCLISGGRQRTEYGPYAPESDNAGVISLFSEIRDGSHVSNSIAVSL